MAVACAWNTSGAAVFATIVADQVRKSSRSPAGTPSSSQITVIGSGNANDASRSTSAAFRLVTLGPTCPRAARR